MSKANPDGEGVACGQEECSNVTSSACYGKLNQHRESALGATGAKRVALEPPILEQPVEPPLDAAAPIKQIVHIIGVRLWDPSKASEPADLRVPLDDDEQELEYLVFGQFVRDDLKDSYGFLSTRWLTVEHLVEHVGLGMVQKAIKTWEATLARCGSAKLEEVAEEAAAEQD